MVAIVTLPPDMPVSVKELLLSSALCLVASFSAFIIGDKIARYEANYSNDLSRAGARESSSPPPETKSRFDSLVQQFHDGFHYKYI